MKEFVIHKNEAGQRFDKYLHKLLKDLPTSMMYKFLRKKTITLNGKKAEGNELLSPNDVVKIFVSDETFEKFKGVSVSGKAAVDPRFFKTHIDILSTNNTDYLILNKPAGVLSQRAAQTDYSVVDFVKDYVTDRGILSEEEMETFAPGICNRLDRNTSGLMIAGISLKGLQVMNEAVKTRALRKYYLAIVKGQMKEPKGILTGFLSKDHARNTVTVSGENSADSTEIFTEYEVLKYENGVSLLKVHLITGLTHQIRAHFAKIGHPLAGDLKYGDPKWNEELKKCGVRRQMLHSCELVFPESIAESFPGFPDDRTFRCNPPGDFMKAVGALFPSSPEI